VIRLHEIPLEYAHFQDLLEESGGELTPELEARWATLTEQGPAKVEAAAFVLKNLKAGQEFLSQEEARLHARRKALEGAEDRLKSLLVPALEALGGKVKTDRMTVYVQRRKTAVFDLLPGRDVWELPDRFYRTRDPELNKTELKKAYDAGEALPDALAVVENESIYPVIR
jgi:hypothetical protein